MAKVYTPILITDTFQEWLDRTNLLTDELANWIVTTDNTIAGGETDGNASINGNLDAFMLSTPIIRGGSNIAGAPLVVDSNLTANFDVTVNQDLTIVGETVVGNVAAINVIASGNVNTTDLLVNNQATWTLPANGDILGNANTANTLATPVTIFLTGHVVGNTVFDGSANVTINTTSDPAGVLADILLVDGSGSLLDADFLDGLDSTQFLRRDISDLMTGDFTATGSVSSDSGVIGLGTSGTYLQDFNGALTTISVGGTNIKTGGSNGQTFVFDTNGNFTAPGDITAFSDERLKSNIQSINAALAKVRSLHGVEFWKDGRKSMGLIAQEVEKVIPEVVHDNESGFKSVAYGNLVGLLIEAIKQLEKRVNELEKDK
jgi:hypothetical protein